MSRLQAALGLYVVSFLLALPGCGSEEREFTASELVEELHSHGAPFQLEGPLPNDQENLEVYDLSISTDRPPAAHGHAGSGATLTISEGEEAAVAEFQRCESSLTLTCFRVANGVLQLAEGDPELLAEVEAAVRAMESE